MQPEWDADVAEFFQGQVPERAEMAAKLQEEREKIESEASLEKVIQETIAQEEHEEALQKHKEAEEEAEKAADEAKLPIRFKDAVGRKFRFPWKYCKTWMVRFLLRFIGIQSDMLSHAYRAWMISFNKPSCTMRLSVTT